MHKFMLQPLAEPLLQVINLSREHTSEQGKDDSSHVVIKGIACI
jgi:hypothetical protein